MKTTKFKEIFSKSIYQLPIRWDGKDFYKTLYVHLKKYREDVNSNSSDSSLHDAVKNVCYNICASVDFSLKGYPEKAYKSFENIMDILTKELLLIHKEEVNKESLYRVVDVGNATMPNRQRVFHVPFSMRSKMSTQRYSIPGFPSLYLGTSVDLCIAELGKDPKRDDVCVSRYVLQTDERVIKNYPVNNPEPMFDDSTFIILDVSIKPEKALEMMCENNEYNTEFIKKYIKWYPLISACSYIRADRRAPYSVEYIIPQLLIQWVRSNAKDSVVGIKYFSCASIYASSLGYNYVFPTTGIPYQVRNNISDYCARLSHRFKLSIPRFIKDFTSICDCVKVMEKDNDLDYIEKYDTNKCLEGEQNFKIQEGTSTIGSYAFFNCSLLENITIPDSVTSIGKHAFHSCTSLKKIDIPDSVTSIGESTFAFCKSLENIKMSNNITSIGEKTFLCCVSLKNFPIPDSVTIIGRHAFHNCDMLTSIHIPCNVGEIGEEAFRDCDSLTCISVADSNKYFSSCDGVLYDKSQSKLICYPASKSLDNFTILNGVETIKDFAFESCKRLQNIFIPNSVTAIGDYAFKGCASLRSINITDNLTTIGNSAFSGCTSLTDIAVSSSNKNFASDEMGILHNKDITELICCPAKMPEKEISISNNVILVRDSAFSNCISLEKINIPNSVSTIGKHAFEHCYSLKDINISDSVTTIDDHTFSYCRSLANIHIPDGVTRIGNNAFENCRSLTSIRIPLSVTSIGYDAFSNCTSLKNVYYSGTKSQKEGIDFSFNNDFLEKKASWTFSAS